MISISDEEHIRLSNYFRENFGVDLINKRTLIEGRLSFHIKSTGLSNYTEYLDLIIDNSDKAEQANMINRLTTNHTHFMRESDHFFYFADKVLPWISSEIKTKDLRLWCAGCSTGQEAYTLSMLVLEYLSSHNLVDWDSKVLATDISNEALHIASEGIYENEDLQSLPINLRQIYFTAYDETKSKVNRTLRNNISFINMNLVEPFNFKKPLHTIFCRNVMIYFDNKNKVNLVDRFYDALMPGGYLFIGHSESLATLDHRFTYVNPAVYRKD